MCPESRHHTPLGGRQTWSPVIGYELGVATARQAYKEGRSIRDVARESTGFFDEELERLLDPLELTRGGIKG